MGAAAEKDTLTTMASLEARERPSVKEVLTSNTARICFYAEREDPRRPHCEELAVVTYGSIALCSECDLRRSAVGKGTAPVHLPDPGTLVALVVARDEAKRAELALAEAVARARRAGQPWSAVGALLGTTRQAAQQRFSHGPPR
jgi:hypothetical protein